MLDPSTLTKILFLTANPSDTAPLQLDEEIRLIGLRIRRGEYRRLFAIQSAPAIRATDLPYELMDRAPDVVHFSGHGSAAGELCFVHEQDHATQPIPASTLARVFKQLGDRLKCVVLNACYSEIQATAIAASIPCVVGMSRAVPDTAAIAFAAGFYEALAFGKSVASAFELGQIQIELADSARVASANTPRLLVRPGVDASQIFLVKRPGSDAASSNSTWTPSARPTPAAPTRTQRISTMSMDGDANRVQIGQYGSASRASHDVQEVADIQVGGTENQVVVEQKDR